MPPVCADPDGSEAPAAVKVVGDKLIVPDDLATSTFDVRTGLVPCNV
jgi:hypothetical protein